MHELTVCQSILSQVEPIAREKGMLVSVVHIQVGPLSGVEIPLLANAWTIARTGTSASGARLEIEEMPITIECKVCDQKGVATANRMVCSHCGEWRTRLISGDEMLLRSIELERVSEQTMEKSNV